MKITIGDWRAVAKIVQEDTPLSHQLDAEYFKEQLETLVCELEKGKALNLGSYCYTPRERNQVEAQSWVCSDGGVEYGSISDLFLRRAESHKLEALECDAQYMIEQLTVPSGIGQGEFESGALRGDWEK